MVRKERRIGVSLGGGGARGLAHIGVLRVFAQEQIPIDLIVGTSIGALVGGAYAAGVTPDEMEKKIQEYLGSSEFESSAMKAFEKAHTRGDIGLVEKTQRFVRNRFYMVQAMFKPGLLSSEDLQDTVNYFIPDVRIEEAKIPFCAVATDLVSGDEIIFSKGPMRQAVLASCSVPGAIAPVQEGDRLLSDGGITCLIPCSIARMEGADVVIAVAVDRDISSEEEFRTVMGVYYRVSEIMGHRLKCYELMEADVVIFPEVGDLHWSSFSQALALIREGEQAAAERMNDIRRAIAGEKGRRFLFRKSEKSM